MYLIVDIRTKEVICRYKNRKRAYNKADKLDDEYGSYRYAVVKEY